MKKFLNFLLVRVVAPALIVGLAVTTLVVAQNPNGIRGAFSGSVIVRAPFRLDLNGHINASGTAGKDFSGSVTLSGGAATVTFTNAYAHAPACVGTDQTAKNVVEITPTTTGLTFAGTSSDVISYICAANGD
jgi:hypothetical protein